MHSAATIGDQGEQARAGLTDRGDVQAVERAAQPARPAGAARTVLAFVQSMDPAPPYARSESAAGRGGAPAMDPAILVALRLWAAIDGVGSAREVDLQRKPAPDANTPKPFRRRGRKGDDDPGCPVATAIKPEPERGARPRVSATDAEARVMKTADGGFRPAFDAQLAVDADAQLTAAVAARNSGSDIGQMSPMQQDIQLRCDLTPDHWMAEGGCTRLQAIDELTARGSQPVVPPPPSRNPEVDPFEPKSTDMPAQAQRREFMGSDFAKALYIQRGATVECADAQLRRRGRSGRSVCGLVTARAVLPWHALARKPLRMRSLEMAFAA